MLFSFSLFLFSFSLLLSLLLIIWSKPAAAFLLLSLSRASTWFPFCSAEPTHSSHLSPSVTSSGTSSTSPACMHTRYRSPIDQPSLRHRISTVPMHHQLLLATRYTCRRSHVTRRLPTSAEPPCALRLLTYKGQPEPALPSSIISLPFPFPSSSIAKNGASARAGELRRRPRHTMFHKPTGKTHVQFEDASTSEPRVAFFSNSDRPHRHHSLLR